jgi:hypothetical protein
MLRTYQSALRRASGESASARKLHETPEIVLRSIPASAREPVKVGHVPSTKGLLDMTSLAPADATDTKPATTSSLPFKLAIVLALAALADVLFYDARIGLSLAIFAIAVAGGSGIANHATLDRQRVLIGGIVVLLGLVPVIEDVNTVSVLLVVMALALALLLATNPETTGLADAARALRNFVLFGPLRFFLDVLGIFSLSSFTRGVAAWFLPAVLSIIFIALFAAANPLIEQWVTLLNPKLIFEYVSIGRILFWTMMLALVWPFIHVRWRKRRARAVAETVELEPGVAARAEFLGAPTILRSLILFNLLFAGQSALDALYLWGHVALPAGVTYAAYAHRGAYPLIVTALLAAAFVLVAMRPGGPAEKSPPIRLLVYIWVGQNVLLVASSILRLDIYVAIYLLTYWRIAAFIWMGLVALGLILIVARIVLDRSNEWLVGANLIALTTVLYLVSLVNFDAIIADYNVAHSREVSGKGVALDVNYLSQLGPQALPAIEKVMQLRPSETCLVGRRDGLVELQRKDMASWRTWSFRSWRLQRRLDAQAKDPVKDPVKSPAAG